MVKLFLFLVVAMFAFAAPGISKAQSWPLKPVRVVVTNPAGQSTDVIARMFAERLSGALGQTFFIDNRPGAGGTIGTAAVAKSAPDGYTLMVGTAATHGISLAMFDNPGYHPERDFIPIGLLGRVPMIVAAPPSLGVKSIGELIAKSRTGELAVALPSPMATLVADLIRQRERAHLKDVTYKGSPMALNDVLGGHIPVLIDTSTVIAPQVAAGKLVALGITTPTQSPLMPGLKTVAEQGLPGFEVTGWFMLFAPAATAPAIVSQLNAEMRKIQAEPEMQKLMTSRGFDVAPVGQLAELTAFVKTEHARWVQVIRASGTKAN